MSYQEALRTAIDETVAPGAPQVDQHGAFPRAAIDALTSAGLLAATVPAEFGGGGLGLSAATDIVRQLSSACGSTAMVVTMHYTATAALVATGQEEILREIADRRHLTTLAFSESGSRSHFWAPVSTATAKEDQVVLDARKSWVTSAHEADSYVWSSTPLEAPGPMTLWLVRAGADGISAPDRFDGLGLRGNDSCPISADAVKVARTAMLGADGVGPGHRAECGSAVVPAAQCVGERRPDAGGDRRDGETSDCYALAAPRPVVGRSRPPEPSWPPCRSRPTVPVPWSRMRCPPCATHARTRNC